MAKEERWKERSCPFLSSVLLLYITHNCCRRANSRRKGPRHLAPRYKYSIPKQGTQNFVGMTDSHPHTRNHRHLIHDNHLLWKWPKENLGARYRLCMLPRLATRTMFARAICSACWKVAHRGWLANYNTAVLILQYCTYIEPTAQTGATAVI